MENETKIAYEKCYDDCRKGEEPKIVINNYTKEYKVSDYIKLGFGFYIGYNIARALKYLVIAKVATKK